MLSPFVGSPKSNAVRFPTDGQPTILSCTSAVAEQAFRKHAVNHSRVQLLVKLRRGRHVVDTKRFQRQPDCQAFLKSACARPNMPSAKTSSPMTPTQCQSPAALQVKATSKTLGTGQQHDHERKLLRSRCRQAGSEAHSGAQN